MFTGQLVPISAGSRIW